jgi:hypothetical protein
MLIDENSPQHLRIGLYLLVDERKDCQGLQPCER